METRNTARKTIYVLTSINVYNRMIDGIGANPDIRVCVAYAKLSEGEFDILNNPTTTTEEAHNAIVNMVNELFDYYKADYKKLTEFCLCVNWKSWSHYESIETPCELTKEERENVAQTYADLWYEVRDKFYDLYRNNEDATDYFFRMTD